MLPGASRRSAALLDRDGYLEAVETIVLRQVANPNLILRVSSGISDAVIRETMTGFEAEFWPLASLAFATGDASVDMIDLAQEILLDAAPEEFFIAYVDILREWHTSQAVDRLVARWHATWIAACTIRPELVTNPKLRPR